MSAYMEEHQRNNILPKGLFIYDHSIQIIRPFCRFFYHLVWLRNGSDNISHRRNRAFQGTVIDAACAVDDNSIEQTVTMGQVRTARFGTAGSVTIGTAANQKVPFSISLKDCDSTVASNASLTLTEQPQQITHQR